MKDEPEKGERKHSGAARQERLKLALRENLKRRKTQARGRVKAPRAVRDDNDGSRQ
jgi:hypothetical protein